MHFLAYSITTLPLNAIFIDETVRKNLMMELTRISFFGPLSQQYNCTTKWFQ